MSRTVIDDIAIIDADRVVSFAALLLDDDDGLLAIHRASIPATADLTAELSAIEALGYPPVTSEDQQSIADALAACPAQPAPAFEDLKAAKRGTIDAQAALRGAEPFSWDFGVTEALDDSGASLGSAGVQTLQVRDIEDEKNWLGAHAGAVAAIMAGAPSAVCPIKTTSNVWVQTTAAMLNVVLATGDGVHLSLLQRQRAVLANYGALKAACEGAATQADLNAINETAGWP